MSAQLKEGAPPAPDHREVTLEGDELYTRVVENLPPEDREGWTIHFIERTSRYWVEAIAGLKATNLRKVGAKG